MAKRNIYLLAACCLILLASCKSTIEAPALTNVSKIISIKAGMTMQEVNTALGIDPYDIYNIQDNGSSILVYNYRIRQREMQVSTNLKKRAEFIKSEEFQNSGKSVYHAEYHRMYALFKDAKLQTMITDNGLENAEYILAFNNTLKILSKDEITKLDVKQIGDNYVLKTDTSTVVNVFKIGSGYNNVKAKNKNATSPSEKKKSGAGKTVLRTLGIVSGGFLLLGLLGVL